MTQVATTVFDRIPMDGPEVRRAVVRTRLRADAGGRAEIAEASSVAATPDGFVVVDRMSSEIIFFDHAGDRLGSVGGPGSGPGEFSKGVFQAVWIGDRLWVPDLVNRRLSAIDVSSRKWLDSSPLRLRTGLPWYWMALPGGKLGALVASGRAALDGSPFDLRYWTGRELRTAFPLSEGAGEMIRGLGSWGAGVFVRGGTRDETFAILDPGAGTVRVHDLAGTVVERYAFDPDDSMALAGADLAYLTRLSARYRRTQRQQRERWAEKIRQRISEVFPVRGPESPAPGLDPGPTFGDRYPFFLNGSPDPATGSIWFARPMTAGEMRDLSDSLGWEGVRQSAKYWDRYGVDGAFRERLEFPPGVVVTEVRDGRFYGYEMDESGLQHAIVLSPP